MRIKGYREGLFLWPQLIPWNSLALGRSTAALGVLLGNCQVCIGTIWVLLLLVTPCPQAALGFLTAKGCGLRVMPALEVLLGSVQTSLLTCQALPANLGLASDSYYVGIPRCFPWLCLLLHSADWLFILLHPTTSEPETVKPACTKTFLAVHHRLHQ